MTAELTASQRKDLINPAASTRININSIATCIHLKLEKMYTLAIRILISVISVFSTNAHSWSPFGPNNFDDCIIQNMKGVTSNTAAAAIRMACRQKFPEKIDPTPQLDLSRAGYPRVDVWDKNYAAISFSNITTGRLQRNQYGEYLPITNKNNFALTGVYLGILKDKNQKFCSKEKSDYSQIYQCDGTIEANTTSNTTCGSITGAWCLVGFKGSYELNVDKFFSTLK
jgi:hypothetical protein